MGKQMMTDEPVDKSKRWSFLDRFFQPEPEMEEDEEPIRSRVVQPDFAAPRPQPRRGQSDNTLQLVQTQRGGGVITRRQPRSLEDATRIAEDLRERKPVIVNLEQTEEDVARRVIDFISGVTYALNGFYEKVGERIFLFTPSNVVISDEDEEMDTSGKGIYHERAS